MKTQVGKYWLQGSDAALKQGMFSLSKKWIDESAFEGTERYHQLVELNLAILQDGSKQYKELIQEIDGVIRTSEVPNCLLLVRF